MIKEYIKGVPERLSPHFLSIEWDCQCRRESCQITYIDIDLIEYLERKRIDIAKPFDIVSGFRCTAHNKEVGGKPGSQHLQGKAADIRIDDEDMRKIASQFEDAPGLGRYASFIHVDVAYGKGGNKRRWVG